MRLRSDGRRTREIRFLAGLVLALAAGTSAMAQQRTLSTRPARVGGSCVGSGWEAREALTGFVVKDLAVSAAGELFMTGVAAIGDGTTRLATARSADGGSWEWVDLHAAAPGESAGGHALHVGADGAVYALGWERLEGRVSPVLRKSDSGDFGTFWSSWTGEAGQRLGAVAGDDEDRVYLAVGHAAAPGWAVLSAFRAEGAWATEDDYRAAEPAVFSAHPYALTFDPADGLLVAGQLNGEPDLWVLRRRNAGGAWSTADLFEYTPQSYGLAAVSLAFPGNGRRLVVVGYGVPGEGDAHDYRWLVRSAPLGAVAAGRDEDRWTTEAFQLEPGRSSFALDSAVDARGLLLAVGTADSAEGTTLVVRRSPDRGRTWRTLLQLPGLTSNQEAWIAVGPDGTYWAAAIAEEATVVLSCGP